MCGISGFLSFTNNTLTVSEVKNILHSLKNRGPDGTGVLTYDTLTNSNDKIKRSNINNIEILKNFILIHSRLSIIDIKDRSNQPMVSADGNYAIIFNGEIYNFLEIKKKLEKDGVKFNTLSDTEVLLNGYKFYGEKILNQIEGMYAFCILDLKKNILFCARDPFGIKPFYYHSNDNFFAFASTPKTLLEIRRIKRVPNYNLLYDFIINGRNENSEESFFEGIKQLKPGTFLEISTKSFKINIKEFWNLNFKTKNNLNFEQTTYELKKLINSSIKEQLVSDVPLCSFLSGGLDSSIICKEISNITKQKLNTFSFVAKNFEFSEEKWINLMNKEISAKAHLVYPESDELANSLDYLTYEQDEPYASCTIFAQYSIFKKIKELGFKVVLDGQGSDELFAGYRSYMLALMSDQIKGLQLISLIKNIQSIIFYPKIFNINSILFLKKNILKNFFFKEQLPGWINKESFNRRYNFDVKVNKTNNDSEIKKLIYKKFYETSLPHLLRLGDRNSMSCSIENRFPFLNTKIAQLAFEMPDDFLIKNGNYKHILKETYKNSLPTEIINRKMRIGFYTPMQNWLVQQRHFLEKIINSDICGDSQIFNKKELLNEWNRMITNKTYFDWRFWRWISVIKWLEVFEMKNA